MRIGIIGLGLIGGSLGLALRELNKNNFPPPLAGEGQGGGLVRVEALEVVGVARTPEGAAAAQQRGAVDSASADMAILKGADVVVIATPIAAIRHTISQLAPHLTRDTMITDVASVKRPVLEWARDLPHPARFLGGHPVAGKTQTGLSASDPSIFRDEPWIFTPSKGQDLAAFEPWFGLVRAIGARPTFVDAVDHDRQMAYLSHLAFTLSAAFAETVERNADASLGGPGYRSMVRLAGGDPAMYESIARENRQPLTEAIDRFTQILADYRERIDHGDQVRELFMAGQHVGV
jgi:prephenate dehydrogenase